MAKFTFEGMNYWWAQCMECDTNNIILSIHETLLDPDSDDGSGKVNSKCNNCEADISGIWNQGYGPDNG